MNVGPDMRRREFIGLIGGVAAAWPGALKAQPAERVRVVGILSALVPDDSPLRR